MTCNAIGCTDSHVGKFDSCRDEALYELTMDGTGETTGDVEAYGHHTIVILHNSDNRLVELCCGRSVGVSPGAYIVTQTSSGSVIVASFDNETSARVEFSRLSGQYETWDDHMTCGDDTL